MLMYKNSIALQCMNLKNPEYAIECRHETIQNYPYVVQQISIHNNTGQSLHRAELHRILRFFGIREQLGPNSTIRSSVFGNFSLANIFGLRSSKTFHQRRSSVFGIRIFFINEDLRSSVFVNCWNQIVQIYSYLIYK